MVFSIVGSPSYVAGTKVGSIKLIKDGELYETGIEVETNGSTLWLVTEDGNYKISCSRESIGGGLYPGTFVFAEGQSATPVVIEEITIDWPS